MHVIVEHGDVRVSFVEQEGPRVMSVARHRKDRFAVRFKVRDGHSSPTSLARNEYLAADSRHLQVVEPNFVIRNSTATVTLHVNRIATLHQV